MKDKLQPRDFRFISICLVLAAAATWFSFGNFYRAFPEASIDFRVDRDQAGQRANRGFTRGKVAIGAGLAEPGHRGDGKPRPGGAPGRWRNVRCNNPMGWW